LDVFQGANGHLWTFAPGGAHDTGLAMAPGTSPCAAILTPGGGLEIGFQAPNGELRVRAPGEVGGAITNTGISMAAGTSPSINVVGVDGFGVVVHASNGNLAGYFSTGSTANWPFTQAAGTSPSIRASSSGLPPLVAFQGANGHLLTFTFDSPAPTDTGLSMKPGTSPIVVPLAFG
jgi:hypothetical protein